MVVMVVMMVILPSSTVTAISNISLENCPQTCGNVSVPYPFGIGSPECAKNKDFLLNCSQSDLFYGNILIYNISIENGTITGGIWRAYNCDNESYLWQRNISLRISPFTISHTQNKLIGLGCDTVASMSDNLGGFGSGCFAVCNYRDDIESDGSCSGFGCCQTSIPKHLNSLNFWVSSFYNHRYVSGFNPCSYAYVVENSFNISTINFLGHPNETLTSTPAVLEWVVGKQHCQAREGFTGNPYLLNGCQGGFGSVYKAVLADNIEVAVKKAKDVDKERINEEFQHEISIVSQVNHKNVVKLLGLCLETKVPLLVYEFISNGTLYHHIHDKRSHVLRSWKNRLRIAAEIALALDYLHSLADPPIIHGDVKSMNVLLDDHYTAKVSDFGASVLISPNQTGIGSKIQGTLGYLDPEYLMTGNLTTKSDVYSFGVVLVELLTGEKPTSGVRDGEKRNIIQYFILSIEDGRIAQVLNFEPADDEEMKEVEEVAELVKRCLNGSSLKRPTMKEVAEELARLKRLSDNVWAKEENKEAECLLGESSSYNYESNTKMEQMETYTVHTTFDIEQASTLSI
ncbi:hypothetical protein SLEP1_g11248 [Rubroshorea leprosula]|uniref:Protein kinase domain-containing protein n=1 Tax=Rubroshorea leprosula TaxID=152421 RepID=A0AAV5IGK3_9ROSI|nr:hypothetical protein SLEP1_g11248 [Rubroshorea leprosula]